MPSITFVYIIGKHINMAVKITTLDELNHTKAIIIMDITGVDFTVTTRGPSSSSINLFSPEIIPVTIPIAMDNKIPIITLNILLKLSMFLVPQRVKVKEENYS